MIIFRLNLILLLLIVCQLCNGQVLASFNWNSGSVTTASSGTSATSVSSSATISSGGSSGYGLNPGLPKKNLNLTITSTATFDVEGIDISLDFQRDETTAQFVDRGSSLSFGMTNGNLSVSYRVSNGAGSYTTVSSGTVYSIPNDDIFRTYRFKYTPLTGIGEVLVDGTSLWTNDGTDNRNMYWTGAGNIIIGSVMNGGGANKPCLDELSITKIANTLPIELTSFNVTTNHNFASINWTTASEKNNDFFIVEKSINGNDWKELIRISGAGNSNQELSYSTTDENLENGRYYYRLKQTDFDGSSVISGERFVKIKNQSNHVIIFPNPSHDHLNIMNTSEEMPEILIINSIGEQSILRMFQDGEIVRINTSNLKVGLYELIIRQGRTSSNYTFEKI